MNILNLKLSIFLCICGGFTPLCAQFSWLQTAQTTAPLPFPDSLPPVIMAEYTQALQVRAKMLLDTALLRNAQAATARAEAEIAYNNAKNDSTVLKTDKDALTTRFKATKTIENNTKKQQKTAEKSLQLAEALLSMDSLQQTKNVKRCWQSIEKTLVVLYPPPPVEKKEAPKEVVAENAPTAPDSTSLTVKTTEPEKKKTKMVEKSGPVFKSYQIQEDVMLNPPSPPCVLASQTKDEFSGEVRKETQRAEILRYTNPMLRNYLQGKTHISCEASLSTAGPSIFLNLVYTIQDPAARKAFGGVAKNSIAILKFVDGSTLSIYNLRSDEGTMDASGQVATFRAQYDLDKSYLKKLRTTELDKIRMAWTTGYEDYEVQQIDLLMRLSKCL
jgi:hypothetical protein